MPDWINERRPDTAGWHYRGMTEAAFMPLLRDGFSPVPDLAATRDSTPVTKLEFPFGITAWLISGYDEVRQVLGDAVSFSNDYANLTASTGGVAAVDQDPGGLGFADPPKHTRLRKALTPEFTMRRLQRLVPRIEALVEGLLDDMAAGSQPADLWATFAMPLPSLVICELLDVPFPDRDEFSRFSTARFDLFGGAGTGLDAISESLVYMSKLVAAQRQSPGDGLLGMLIREHGDEIDDRELAGLADGLLVGGHETTASMLALGALLLMQSPEHVELVKDPDGPINQVVEELLRYLTVVQVAFPRFARHDLEVGGIAIKQGEMILCSLTAPNRDPKLGNDMELFDPRRPVTSHFAFGHGVHRCVGAELARMELRIAYPRLFRRFPDLRTDVPLEQIAFRQYSLVHGVDSLPVRW